MTGFSPLNLGAILAKEFIQMRRDRNAVLARERRQRGGKAVVANAGDVQRRAERRDLLDAVKRLDARHEFGRRRRGDDERRQA